jgi:hypothetical protein
MGNFAGIPWMLKVIENLGGVHRKKLYRAPCGAGAPARGFCKCSKIMSPLNCNENLSSCKDGDDESERVPTSESD